MSGHKNNGSEKAGKDPLDELNHHVAVNGAAELPVQEDGVETVGVFLQEPKRLFGGVGENRIVAACLKRVSGRSENFRVVIYDKNFSHRIHTSHLKSPDSDLYKKVTHETGYDKRETEVLLELCRGLLKEIIRRKIFQWLPRAATAPHSRRSGWCFTAKYCATPAALCRYLKSIVASLTQGDKPRTFQTVLLIECKVCRRRQDLGALELNLKDGILCENCKHPTLHRLIEIREPRKRTLPLPFSDRRKSPAQPAVPSLSGFPERAGVALAAGPEQAGVEART